MNLIEFTLVLLTTTRWWALIWNHSNLIMINRRSIVCAWSRWGSVDILNLMKISIWTSSRVISILNYGVLGVILKFTLGEILRRAISHNEIGCSCFSFLMIRMAFLNRRFSLNSIDTWIIVCISRLKLSLKVV